MKTFRTLQLTQPDRLGFLATFLESLQLQNVSTRWIMAFVDRNEVASGKLSDFNVCAELGDCSEQRVAEISQFCKRSIENAKKAGLLSRPPSEHRHNVRASDVEIDMARVHHGSDSQCSMGSEDLSHATRLAKALYHRGFSFDTFTCSVERSPTSSSPFLRIHARMSHANGAEAAALVPGILQSLSDANWIAYVNGQLTNVDCDASGEQPHVIPFPRGRIVSTNTKSGDGSPSPWVSLSDILLVPSRHGIERDILKICKAYGVAIEELEITHVHHHLKRAAVGFRLLVESVTEETLARDLYELLNADCQFDGSTEVRADSAFEAFKVFPSEKRDKFSLGERVDEIRKIAGAFAEIDLPVKSINFKTVAPMGGSGAMDLATLQIGFNAPDKDTAIALIQPMAKARANHWDVNFGGKLFWLNQEIDQETCRVAARRRKSA